MDTEIKLRISKELSSREQRQIIKLKGSIIATGYTEIIHIQDYDQQCHLNTFETQAAKSSEVKEFINAFMEQHSLGAVIEMF